MIRLPSRFATLVFLLALAAAGVSACTTAVPERAVAVMGPWTGVKPGTEGYEFRQVLRAFTAKTGIPVDYKDTRALTQVLLSNVQAGTPPDVALLSSAGDLARYARNRQLFPLDDVLSVAQREAFPPSWLLPQEVDGVDHVFAVPLKVNPKSMIWHAVPTSAPTGVTTWEELVAHSASRAREGVVPWCMGLSDGPSSGWPATDFIEDLMLSRFGAQTYQEWAAGEVEWTSKEVTAAWTDWGRIAAGDNFVRGGRTGAVLTDFGDAGRSMFDEEPGCEMEHQASFIMGFYRNYPEGGERRLEPGVDFDFFPFPAFTTRPAGGSPVVASADFAGMFNDTPEARKLMTFLATDEAQSIWPAIPGAGAFAVNDNVRPDLYEDDVSRRIATTLREAPGVCFDAADIMPATMRNAFYRATLDYLADPDLLPSLLDQLERIHQAIPDEDWLDRLSCHR